MSFQSRQLLQAILPQSTWQRDAAIPTLWSVVSKYQEYHILPSSTLVHSLICGHYQLRKSQDR